MEILKNTLKRIEDKRNASQMYWRVLVFLKDSAWVCLCLCMLFMQSIQHMLYRPIRNTRLFFGVLPKHMQEFLQYTYKQLTTSSFETYCINLTRRQDKRTRMSTVFTKIGLKPIFFAAIDGTDMSIPSLKKKGIVAHAKVNPSEVGCYLSHYEIWKRISKKKVPLTLICEDDIFFKCTLQELHETAAKIPADADLFYLDLRLMPVSILNEHVSVFKNTNIVYGTSCYFITAKGAKKLMEHALPIAEAVDTYIQKELARGTITIYAATRGLAGSVSLRPNWPESYVTNKLNSYYYQEKDVTSDIPEQ